MEKLIQDRFLVKKLKSIVNFSDYYIFLLSHRIFWFIFQEDRQEIICLYKNSGYISEKYFSCTNLEHAFKREHKTCIKRLIPFDTFETYLKNPNRRYNLLRYLLRILNHDSKHKKIFYFPYTKRCLAYNLVKSIIQLDHIKASIIQLGHIKASDETRKWLEEVQDS